MQIIKSIHKNDDINKDTIVIFIDQQYNQARMELFDLKNRRYEH